MYMPWAYWFGLPSSYVRWVSHLKFRRYLLPKNFFDFGPKLHINIGNYKKESKPIHLPYKERCFNISITMGKKDKKKGL